MVIAGAIAVAAASAAWYYTWHTGIVDLRTRGAEQLALHRDALQATIERYRYLPYVLAQDAVIRRLMAHPHDAALVAEANAYLLRINNAASSTTLYVMDGSGMTLASSNFGEPTSYVGQSYEFRPYFQQAITSGEGRYYAIGITTGLPGYFLAHRIAGDDGAVGVAAVKVDLVPLEASWQQTGGSVAITDLTGIAFLSSREDWKYRPAVPLSEEERARLIASNQYSGIDLSQPSLLRTKADLRDGAVVTIRRRGLGADAPPLLLHRLELPQHNWVLIATSELGPLAERSFLVAGVTGLALALTGMLALFLRQRRQLVRAKLEAHSAS